MAKAPQPYHSIWLMLEKYLFTEAIHRLSESLNCWLSSPRSMREKRENGFINVVVYFDGPEATPTQTVFSVWQLAQRYVM